MGACLIAELPAKAALVDLHSPFEHHLTKRTTPSTTSNRPKRQSSIPTKRGMLGALRAPCPLSLTWLFQAPDSWREATLAQLEGLLSQLPGDPRMVSSISRAVRPSGC